MNARDCIDLLLRHGEDQTVLEQVENVLFNGEAVDEQNPNALDYGEQWLRDLTENFGVEDGHAMADKLAALREADSE